MSNNCSSFSGFQEVGQITIKVHQGRTWDTKERFPGPWPPATETYRNRFIAEIECHPPSMSPSGSLKFVTRIASMETLPFEIGRALRAVLESLKQPEGEREIKS